MSLHILAFRNRGVSMFGFIMVLLGLIIVGVLGMKIGPMYMEFNSVKSAMNGVAAERFESAGSVKDALMKRLGINYVESIQRNDIVVRTKEGAYEVVVDYYVDKPLVGNLSVTAHFTHTVTTAP